MTKYMMKHLNHSTQGTYGDLLKAEVSTTNTKIKAVVHKKIQSIKYIRDNVESNLIIGILRKEEKFETVTQKIIYNELLLEQSRDHTYQTKWVLEIEELGVVEWDRVWNSIHNSFFTEEVNIQL